MHTVPEHVVIRKALMEDWLVLATRVGVLDMQGVEQSPWPLPTCTTHSPVVTPHVSLTRLRVPTESHWLKVEIALLFPLEAVNMRSPPASAGTLCKLPWLTTCPDLPSRAKWYLGWPDRSTLPWLCAPVTSGWCSRTPSGGVGQSGSGVPPFLAPSWVSP